jgi:hypothetical protein
MEDLKFFESLKATGFSEYCAYPQLLSAAMEIIPRLSANRVFFIL